MKEIFVDMELYQDTNDFAMNFIGALYLEYKNCSKSNTYSIEKVRELEICFAEAYKGARFRLFGLSKRYHADLDIFWVLSNAALAAGLETLLTELCKHFEELIGPRKVIIQNQIIEDKLLKLLSEMTNWKVENDFSQKFS